MRTKFIQAVLLPNQRYVCLSCRLQSVGVEKGRRYQHAASLERGEADTNPTRSSETPKKENNGESGSSVSIRDTIRALVFDGTSLERRRRTPMALGYVKLLCCSETSRSDLRFLGNARH